MSESSPGWEETPEGVTVVGARRLKSLPDPQCRSLDNSQPRIGTFEL